MGLYTSAYRFGSNLINSLKQPPPLPSLSGTPTAAPKPAAIQPPPTTPNPAARAAALSGDVNKAVQLQQQKYPGFQMNSGVAPKTAVAPAGVVNQLRAPAPATPSAPSPAPTNSGFSSTDPAIQARIQAMQQQAAPPPSPTPAPNPNVSSAGTPNIQMAGAGSTGGSAYSPSTDIQKYREGVLAALRPSDQEQALKDQLAQFQGSAREGIAGLEGQGRGIPLGIVRGQQEQLQRQANIQEQTLMERLAGESANRQAALDAAKLQLGFTQEDVAAQQAAQAANKPFEFGGNLVQLNPATGQYETVLQGPTSGSEGFTLGEGQARYDAQGNLIAGNEKQVDPLVQRKAQLEIQALEQKAALGGLTPSEQMQLDQKKQEQAGQKQMAINTLQDKSALIDRILANPSSKLAVNPWGLASVPDPLQAANRQRFKADLNQLLNQATIDNLIAVKAAGGSFGALSEGELSLLKQSASPIASWLQPDGTIKASVNDFTNALNDLKNKTNRALQMAQQGGDLGGASGGGGQFSPADLQYLQQNLSPEEFQYIQNQPGFNSDLGRSVNGPIVSMNIGTKPVQVSNQLAPRLAAADADFFLATGQHLAINESLRSSQRQAQLYSAYKTGQGGRAAPPGQSFHEKGLAVDIGNWQQAAPYLRKYGLKNDLADDRNHFSLGEFA